uniref:FXYD domain-containing ion transport regulator n=1 Tax=Acanthochromis polyacanthus TaxID=80966 RepID=A0A3Q1G6J3_9TELE
MATAETMFPDQSDFDYDYETLRTTGVILAVIMFVSGILIALSKFRLSIKYPCNIEPLHDNFYLCNLSIIPQTGKKFTKCVKSSSNSSSSGTQIPKTEVPPPAV